MGLLWYLNTFKDMHTHTHTYTLGTMCLD